MRRRPISHAWLLAAACLLAIAPFFWWGIPSGHDFEFHMFSWMEVLSQWQHSIVYPRWAALAHWGYGEARFLFYPPASWTLGAVLGAILPWKIVPGAYCWIALTLAGGTMYRLAREWLAASDALFAALFYALNPYHLLIVYWRSAYAELLAAALLPLLILCLLRIDEPGFRPTLGLSLTLGAAWLTNAPAAVMIHYSAASLALLVFMVIGNAAPRRSWGPHIWRPLLRTALAAVLGAGLASFYLVPAIYEQRWINLSQVMAPGVRPQDNFLFTTIADPDHNRFNRLVSSVALAEIGVLALTVCLSYVRRRERAGKSTASTQNAWMLLSVWGAASAFFMVSPSISLWQHLPKFRFVQLPFRWLLCLNAALAALLTLALRRWSARIMASAVLLGVVIVAGYRVQPPWWDTAGDIREMSDAVADGSGYEGTDEYVPTGADAYELNQNAPRISEQNGSPVVDEMLDWGQTEKHFVVHMARPERLELRLLNYPAWQVTINDQLARAESAEVTGQMIIAVPEGKSEVRIRFRRTIDRTIGDAISWVSLILLAAAWIKTRPGEHANQRILIATSNPGKLRDFAGAATLFGVTIKSIPNFSSLPEVVEDGITFEENARKKAESYSLAVPGELVLADDSGLEIDALGGAPGVRSARYSGVSRDHAEEAGLAESNSNSKDEANNARVLRELAGVAPEKRTGRFVCVLAVARDGQTIQTFRGTAEGVVLDRPRGKHGFGYDPLFYFPQIGKTFAELNAEEKAHCSHRGVAFRAFLTWHAKGQLHPPRRSRNGKRKV